MNKANENSEHLIYKIPDKEDKIGVLLNSVIYYDVFMNPVWLPYLSNLRRYGDYSLHKYGELYILNDVYKDMGQVVSEIDNINKKIEKLEKAQWGNSKAGTVIQYSVIPEKFDVIRLCA